MQPVVLIFAALLASPVSAGEPAHLGIKELANSMAQYVDKPVSIHGCLVNSPHGSFIKPCGSSASNDLVLIVDPMVKVPAAFQDLSIDYSQEIEGDFSGVIVKKTVNWPTKGNRLFLRLDCVDNAVPYEP